jgi:hemoglobin
MYDTITEDNIAELVDSFYSRIRDDQLLGPIFADAIGNDWGPHLDKMKRFWSSVVLATRKYKGNPMMAHLQLLRLTEDHFGRWLQLWSETVAGLCSEELARFFIGRAEMIGERLLHAISSYHESVTRESEETAQGAL